MVALENGAGKQPCGFWCWWCCWCRWWWPCIKSTKKVRTRSHRQSWLRRYQGGNRRSTRPRGTRTRERGIHKGSSWSHNRCFKLVTCSNLLPHGSGPRRRRLYALCGCKQRRTPNSSPQVKVRVALEGGEYSVDSFLWILARAGRDPGKVRHCGEGPPEVARS